MQTDVVNVFLHYVTYWFGLYFIVTNASGLCHQALVLTLFCAAVTTQWNTHTHADTTICSAQCCPPEFTDSELWALQHTQLQISVIITYSDFCQRILIKSEFVCFFSLTLHLFWKCSYVCESQQHRKR